MSKRLLRDTSEHITSGIGAGPDNSESHNAQFFVPVRCPVAAQRDCAVFGGYSRNAFTSRP